MLQIVLMYQILIALDIANEHHYQIDLYFNVLIEPSITYTYPNEY